MFPFCVSATGINKGQRKRSHGWRDNSHATEREGRATVSASQHREKQQKYVYSLTSSCIRLLTFFSVGPHFCEGLLKQTHQNAKRDDNDCFSSERRIKWAPFSSPQESGTTFSAHVLLFPRCSFLRISFVSFLNDVCTHRSRRGSMFLLF